jgi:hypothetical protein
MKRALVLCLVLVAACEKSSPQPPPEREHAVEHPPAVADAGSPLAPRCSPSSRRG